MDVQDEVARAVAELRARADPGRAESERRYLKSDLAHIGVPVPVLRKVVMVPAKAVPTRAALLALADTFWEVREEGRPLHEARMAAVEVLIKRVALLEPRDMDVVERLVRDSSSWVYVDQLAEKVAGALVVRHPPLGAVLDAWVRDPYMWIRRTAMLALLAGVRSGTPDLDRISGYGDALLEEREFFIRKAIGWVLRELARKDPSWVAEWVAARTGAISGVAIREAVRPLPDGDAARLLDAYRSRSSRSRPERSQPR